MAAVLRVVPVIGETTWSFFNWVAAAYRLEAGDPIPWWRSANLVPRRHGEQVDGDVLLDPVARAQLAGWCRIPVGHLAQALPSWIAGPTYRAGAGRLADGGAR
ncbi:hypothetical protein OG981_53095 [Streptomyces mirabilis]|uniref:hypothetical protein n=1 Tax=Streptomyces mirabilis TaxID=68239 RepID=UPI002E1CF70E